MDRSDLEIYSGYEIEKSKDNSNQFEKINIEEQERQNELEDYFNGEKDAEEEEDVIYLEDVDDSEDKDDKEDEN